MKVLVVDDDALSLRLLIALVERLGHEPLAASDGLAAWELFEQHRFGVVISDWNMPVLDGIGLLKRIRAAGGDGYTYFIMLTARSEREDVSAGMAAGADDLLTKPVSRDDLAARLNVGQRIVSLQREVAGRNLELMRANVRMCQDLAVAARVQESLLPTAPPQVPGMAFSWAYCPCEDLGGDTLGLFAIDDRHLGFYVLDVSGHGVPSALLAVQASRSLAPMASGGLLVRDGVVTPPGEVVRALNRLYPMNSTVMQFFTIIYGVYDRQLHRLHMVSAGHPGPILIGSAGARLIELTGNPIGCVPDGLAEFDEIEMDLAVGERLVFYSDGAYEATSSDGEQFGIPRLAALITANGGGPTGNLDGVLAGLEHWRSGARAEDDITFLVIARDH